MGAVKQDAIMEGLRTLVPISALPDDKFKQLADTLQIEELGSGKELFQEGDTDARAVYLISGKVVMLSGKSIVDTIVGGTDHARYPLAHHIPRQLTARSKSKVRFVRIDTHMLDRLLTADTSAADDTYEVTDVLEDDDDWMAQLLQAEALINLPPENIQAMFMQLEEVPLKAGNEVVREGEQGEYFYLLRSGKAKVLATDNSGKTKVVAEIGPGDSFGEEALISGGKRNATVTMLTDGILMRLEQENFDRLMKDPLINWVTYDEAADIVKDGGTWLDVRLPNEHSKVSIAGSKNLPLSVLRNNIDRLDPNDKYVTYCDNGKRSSVAAFLLSQRGFVSYVLAGGYKEPDRAPEKEEASQEKPDKEVLDFNKSQIEARKKAEEEVARINMQRSDAETRAEQEARKRAELEQELANMKAEQQRARQQAEDEVNKRLDAEKAVAQMKKEQENAFKKAQEEIQKRQQAEKEATRIKAEADKARKKAEAEAAKLKAEREKLEAQSAKELEDLHKQREDLRSQAFATAEKLKVEAQAARAKAEAENARLKAEAEAARKKAEDDNARLREEADAARRNAEQEAERLAKEQQEVRIKAEAEAARLKKEAEEIRKRAEIDARKRSEELASEIVAEAEAARLKAEQEAAQLIAEAESARLDAEAEHAKFLSSQEQARLEAEQQVAKLQAESEQLRLASEEEQRRMNEIEAQRLAAEEEASRLRNEAESTRMAAEEEAQRRMSEAEAARLEAEEEAARIKAEAEAARLKAEEEAQRLAAEVEQARMSDASSDAGAMARLESEAEAARLEAEQAKRLKQEAEDRRKAAEQEAIRLKVEVEQTRQAAEDEAQQLIKDAETSRKQAEKEAAKVAKEADKARKKAKAEADKLTVKAEKARKKAEVDASRIKSEADEAHKKAEDMVARMRREAEALREKAAAEAEAAEAREAEEKKQAARQQAQPDIVDEIADELLATQSKQAEPEMDEVDRAVAELAAAAEVIEIDDDAGAVEAIEAIPEIVADDSEDSDLIVLNEPVVDPSSLLVSHAASDEEEDDEVSRLINATAEESDRSGFVVPDSLQAQPKKSASTGLIVGGGIAAVAVIGIALWLLLGGEDAVTPPPQVATGVQQRPAPAEPVTPAPQAQAKPEPQPVVPAEPVTPAPQVQAKPEPQQAVPAEATPVESDVPSAPAPDPVELAKIAPKPDKPEKSAVVDIKPSSFRDALKVGGSAPTMVRIRAGSFTMGSGTQSTNFDERPSRDIKVGAFNMSRHEVTVADYRRFLQATGRSTAAFKGKDGKLPVSGVSWISAQQYVKWLSAQTGRSYRLPSEVEWEYAARAGTNSVFWWGNEVGNGNANCFDCNSAYDGKLAPVGQFSANVFGLYDMAGNVMEWTQDCANKNYNGAPANASAWERGNCTSRIARGGAYNTPSDSLRSRKRSNFELKSELDNIGLRLVRD
jgi:formylglycine-generating enzyme required for sulfatase activity/CRP-like cAMP-binding protein